MSNRPVPVPAQATCAWDEGRVWLSQPRGLVILSTAEQVVVESGGQLLMSLRLHRPDAMVLLDEVILQLVDPRRGLGEGRLSVVEAHAWIRGAEVGTNRGAPT